MTDLLFDNTPYFGPRVSRRTIGQEPQMTLVQERQAEGGLPDEADLRLLDDAAIGPIAG
jgi:hypothetical protein